MNRILRNLRRRHGYLSGEQRFGRLYLNGGQVQIRRVELQREPGFTGIFVSSGDEDRQDFNGSGFSGRSMDASPGERDGWRAPVVHGQSQPAPGSLGKRKPKLAGAAGLTENRLAPSQHLPAFAVGRTFNVHRLDEAAGATFQRDALQWLREPGLECDNGRGGIQ